MNLSSRHVFIVVAPSGAGKTSLVSALLKQRPDLSLSISFTTRAPRPGEVSGRDYHFVSQEEFAQRQQDGEFLESAKVHGNWYGTSQKVIAGLLQSGNDVVLEIDWQGAQQVKRAFPGAIGIFILPPSFQVLSQRLRNRGQDSAEVIDKRLNAARGEMAHAHECDYVVINDDFTRALGQLAAIIESAALRFQAQAQQHPDLFQDLGVPVNR